ncbi:hypothetical protein Btru_044969 [Bulinus truncatus]|nr:hypothetical protein Btru_044969 [Bulinus truncatus]
MSERKRYKVVVIGAGIVGLSSAVVIQQSCPDIAVEIVADVFSPDTTSDGSAGFWEPYAMGSDMDRVVELSRVTYDYLMKIVYSPQAADAGITLLSGFTLSDKPEEEPEFKHFVQGYRQLTHEELARFSNIKANAGYFYTSVQVEVTTYLPWLMKKFIDNGGKVRKATVKNLNEISKDCDLIVTCCSLGARDLLQDKQIGPTRGQVFRRYKVVVIGAGIGGLSSAVVIQQSCPDIAVEIVADVFSPDTTSDGSAGFWEPYAMGSDMDRVVELSRVTYDYLMKIVYSPQAADAGITLLSGFTLSDKPEEEPEFKHFVQGYRQLTHEELARFSNIKANAGYFYTSVQVEVTTYLPWLMKKFIDNGGKVRKATVKNLNEISKDCDLIVTCCSLGARDLLQDKQIGPTRGQVFRVKAPWIKHFYFYKPASGIQDYSYILPGINDIVVGGTAQKDDWRTTIDENDSKKIWDSAVRFLPSLSKGTIVRQWAGLRPSRNVVRLEKEILPIGDKKMKVVHNYGFGGSGITLHWGCALETTRLVMESLGYKESSRTSRL